MSCGDSCCNTGAKMCPHPLGYHTDVTTEGAEERDVLVYDADSGMWIPRSIRELCIVLDELCDVTIEDVADENFLIYDSSTSQWVNVSNQDVADIIAPLHNLGDHGDVTLTSPVDGALLMYDSVSGDWIDGTLGLEDLDNVTLGTAGACDVLKWDTGTSQWVNGQIPLNCLSDVILTAPANGQVLFFNGTNWVNIRLNCNDVDNASTAPGTTVCAALSGHETRITTNTNNIATNTAAITGLDGRVTTLEGGGGGGSGSAIIITGAYNESAERTAGSGFTIAGSGNDTITLDTPFTGTAMVKWLQVDNAGAIVEDVTTYVTAQNEVGMITTFSAPFGLSGGYDTTFTFMGAEA